MGNLQATLSMNNSLELYTCFELNFIVSRYLGELK